MDTHKAELESLILSSCEIPPLPATAQLVMKEAMKPDCSADSLSKIIAVDEGLVTYILRVANSAFYSCPRKILNVTTAVVVLGLRTIKNIAITFAAKNTFDKHSYTEQLLWEHSFAVGTGSDVIARRLRFSNIEDIFVCGLLHDVGKVPLHKLDPEQYGYVLEKNYEGRNTFADEERERFKFNHSDVGSMLATKWNLPEEVERAIWLHHQDEPEEEKGDTPISRLADIIKLADAISYKLNPLKPVDDPVFEETVEKPMRALGINKDHIGEIINDIDERLKSEKALLSL
jgi:putative nucleotidyltransferase with HDIG domain